MADKTEEVVVGEKELKEVKQTDNRNRSEIISKV